MADSSSSEDSPDTPQPVDAKSSPARYTSQLAIERTMLAWIRTTLSMVSFGFGTVAFFRALNQTHPSPETHRLRMAAIAFGLTLLVVGLAALFTAAAAHRVDLQTLARGDTPRLRSWTPALGLSAILFTLGLAGLLALLLI